MFQKKKSKENKNLRFDLKKYASKTPRKNSKRNDTTFFEQALFPRNSKKKKSEKKKKIESKKSQDNLEAFIFPSCFKSAIFLLLAFFLNFQNSKNSNIFFSFFSFFVFTIISVSQEGLIDLKFCRIPQFFISYFFPLLFFFSSKPPDTVLSDSPRERDPESSAEESSLSLVTTTSRSLTSLLSSATRFVAFLFLFFFQFRLTHILFPPSSSLPLHKGWNDSYPA